MSKYTDFFPLAATGGGGGGKPQFQEFNSSGTFTPPSALISNGGVVTVFIVGGGGRQSSSGQPPGSGGEAQIKNMTLTNTNSIAITIGAGATNQLGGDSVFQGSSAGGVDVTSQGGEEDPITQTLSPSWGAESGSSGNYSAGTGIFGYGGGGSDQGSVGNPKSGGFTLPKPNSGQAGVDQQNGADGYCLITWVE